MSVERAIDQAEQGRGGQTGDVRWDARDELRLLVTHGTLHVCGWDHAEPDEEAAMRALERELLAQLVGRRPQLTTRRDTMAERAPSDAVPGPFAVSGRAQRQGRHAEGSLET